MLTPVPPTDCMLARENASARLDGELSELDALRLDAHLAVCAACAAFAAGVGATTGAVRRATLEAAPPAIFIRRPRRSRPHLAAVAAASLLLAAAAGSSFLVGQHLGARGASQPLFGGTAVAAAQTDPGLLAMLRGAPRLPSQNRRAVAL